MRGNVKLPLSARRRGAFLKLLWRVDPHAENGFGFEGSILRPGALIDYGALRPSLKYPEIPVLLEHTPGPAYGIPGHRRSTSVYVLWRWNIQERAWDELGRSMSSAWEWALDMRPLALRVLAEARGGTTKEPPPAADLSLVASRLSGFLEEELSVLAEADRARLLGVVHDEFARRFCP